MRSALNTTHESRMIKEEIPAKKGVVDDSIENVRGYLSTANEALIEAYEHIDYSYPIQIGKEVLTTGETSKLDEETQNKVSVNSNKAITLVVDSGASKLSLPTNEGLRKVEQANGRIIYANSDIIYARCQQMTFE